MGLGRREARHDTALSRIHAAESYDYAPGDEVMTPEGYPGKIDSIDDGPVRGNEQYKVTLHGGMGGGTYTSGELSRRSSTTAAGIHLASDDYPELAQVLQERPDIAVPVRLGSLQAFASTPVQPELPQEDGQDQQEEHYDPACAYGHEGPCPDWSTMSHTHYAVHHVAMPPKSGRQPNGKYEYEMTRAGIKGKIDGEDAGYIRHEAYDKNGNVVTGDHDSSETAQAVKVHMLHTNERARGTGVASAMMDSLYHHYPNAWINHGYRTNDGSRWWNGYDEPDPHRNVHNVPPHETGKLDHPWTNHFDIDDVVSDMSSTSDTNAEEGHEGNAHRQWDHTEWGGTNGQRCENCDSDREHYCGKCDSYYPHQHEGDNHRDYDDCPGQCDDCDSDGEHQCHDCGDWVKHGDLEDHQNDHEQEAKDEANEDPAHDPTKVGLHNSVTLNLSREDHDFLHDHTIPTDKRAHHIMNMVGRSQMPEENWVNDGGQAHDEERASQPQNQQGHGRGAHTVVTLHAHPLNERESGEFLGEEHYTRDGDRTSFDNAPTKFRLKGISWGDGSNPEHHHDFSGEGHTVSTPPTGQRQQLPFQPHEVRPLNRQQPHGPAPVPVHPDQQKLFARKTAASFNGMDGGFEDVSDHAPEEEIVTHGSFDPYSLLTVASVDPEFRFHFTASWADVRKKAKRIRAQGGVNITLASDGVVFGNVRGDTNTYETGVQRLPGSRNSIATYSCGCKWGAYHWGAADDFSRFAGRMCSHALALQYEAQSRGMFGRDVVPDTRKPEWVPKHVVIRYDIDSGQNQMVRSASKIDTALDFLVTLARAQGEDPEELAFMLSSLGLPVTAAVNSPWGEPQPERPNYTPGPTKPRNPSENPASVGWASQGDPDNWDSIEPNMIGDRIASLTDEFLFEAAIPQEVAQSDDPLASSPGTEGLPQDLPVVTGAENGPNRPEGPKGGDGGRMPPGHPGMPHHRTEDEGDLGKEAFWQVLLRAAPAIISGVSQMAGGDKKGEGEEADTRTPEQKRMNAEGLEASLHMEPEGALPYTDGDGPDLTDDESLTPPHTASQGVPDIVAQFQATASHLAPGGGSGPAMGKGDASEIAAAAKAALSKMAVKDYTPAEQAAIINEGVHVRASNLDRLDIADTHYAHLNDTDEDDSWL